MAELVLHQVLYLALAQTHRTYRNSDPLLIPVVWKRCESQKRGLEARRHLQEYVGSPYFCLVCGEGTSKAVLKWLTNSLFSIQHKVLFYYRQHVRCFDEYVNSAVEGQHSAIKASNTGGLVYLFTYILAST
jgi:hypothetical protein